MKTFKQFYIEANFNLAKEVSDVEKNLVHSFNRPGHQAPGYSYAGKRAPDRNNPGKEVPQEVRRAQDLRATREKFQKRRLQRQDM